MSSNRTRKRLYVFLSVVVCFVLLMEPVAAANAPVPGDRLPHVSESAALGSAGSSPPLPPAVPEAPAITRAEQQLPSLPSRSAPSSLPERRVTCDLYPIALHSSSLSGVQVGDVIPDILNGTRPGNFGWLTWTGDVGVPALIASLTPPGNASMYINPNNPTDHLVSMGDWVLGRPGVANASNVRAALDHLKTIDISLPVWDTSQAGGGNARYHVTSFAKVRLLSYSLPDQNRITVQFLGFNPSCGDNFPPLAVADTYATDEDIPLLVPVPGVLGNDTDPDDDPLTAVRVTDPIHGALTLNADGSFTYSPLPGYTGTDQFTYKANDGSLDSNVAMVTITITPPACNVGPWASVPDLATARYSHQAVLLSNGKVLVAGGTREAAGAGDDFASTEIYDPATNIWVAGPSMNAARTGFSATVLQDGRVLMAGGEHFGIGQTSAEIYNPATNTWSLAASMGVPRHGHTGTLLQNGSVLVVGGSRQAGNDPAEATAEIYDPQTNQWTSVASMATARQGHTATLLNDGRVLVTGGNSVPWSWTSASKVELYDPGSNTWSPAPDMSISRAAHTATLLNDGRVLVAGGEGAGPSTRASAEVYDATTNTWSPIPDMAVSRSRHTATLLPSGKVLVAGGWSQSQSTILASAEVYNPTNNTWTTTSDLEHARNSHTSTLLCNGKTLFVGGAIRTNTWVAIANAELYDPPPASAAPVAVDDAYETTQDQALTVPAPGVLGNDTDPNGDPLTAVRESDPIHDALTLNADSLFTYTPAAGYNGADSFTDRASHGGHGGEEAAVAIAVGGPPNRPPVAIDHAYGAASNQTLTVAAPGVLANDSDPDSNPLIAILVSHLAHGTLTLNTNGSFSFTPHASYTGPDSFTYMANDGQPQDGLLSSVGIASHGRTLEEKNGHSGQHFHHWLPVYRAHKIIYGSLLAMWALGPA